MSFCLQANSVESMFEYFETVLVPSLNGMSVADSEYATLTSTQFLLGPARLRQQRIQKGTVHSNRRTEYEDILCFTPLLTLFNSFQANEGVIMKGSVQ